MKAPQDSSVKILFRFYSDILEQDTVETMLADTVDPNENLYRLDSIPFYVPLVAPGDIVRAEYSNDDDMLIYSETIEYSGNSVIQVVLMDEDKDINDIRSEFDEFGCTSERLNDAYFAMEIPAEADYAPIKARLTEMEESDLISYAEPCLSEEHQYE